MWKVFYPELFLGLLLFIGVFCLAFFLFKNKALRKRILLVWSVVFVAASALLLLNGYGIKHYNIEEASTKTYSQKELLEDFDLLKNCILKQNPLAFADKTELSALFDEAKKGITEGMTEEEFYRLVNPAVVAAKCGHTNLSVSQALIENRRDRAKFFPVGVSIKAGKIIADASNESFGLRAGDIILSINGRSADEIIAAMDSNISHDGDNTAVARYIAGKHFGYEYYEFVEKPEKFELEVLNVQGEQRSITVDGEYLDKENTAAWQLHLEDINWDKNYEYSLEGENATLTVRVFFEDEPKFANFLAEFFAKIKSEGIENLTIDVRGNFGGAPQMSRELLSYLVDKNTPYFTGDTKLPLLYRLQGLGKDIVPKENRFLGEKTLIIDGGCFSTCGHFAAVFKANALGSVTGEQTGGGEVCTDGSKDIVLRNTGLRLHCSQTVYAVAAGENMRNTVTPD